ncbi:ATPase, T2SS/T4P/T4SS family [Achromobacter sp. F4_2707]|uniref:GspE/PulE family protein n=1 Tax=Achromobacter sp. F4_2707 TaxID=3114286 RepID=UPI0039C6679F
MLKRLAGWRSAAYRDTTSVLSVRDVCELPRYAAASAGTLPDTEALLNLKPALRRSLSTQFGVEGLAARLCPVELEDGSAAIFALAEHVGSDQADELARRLKQAGYLMAEPARYVLNASLLLAVARDAFRTSAGLVEAVDGRGALAEAFHELVEWGVVNRASDLHLNVNLREPESEVKYTLCGRYVAPECFRRMPTRMLMEMLAVAWMDISGGNGAVFDPGIEQQGSLSRTYAGREVMLRWASMASETGPSVCLRLLEKNLLANIPPLESLGYPPAQIALLEQALCSGGGAVVFAGTVGSGKSTTLASLIARLPADRKVVTIEDPVEYTIPGAIQNSIARRLDTDAHAAFATKLRALKRSAMSDVLLGEVRDRETGLAFMDLAGSGVNLYTTVHAPSAVFIPERLASDFIGVSRDFLAMPGTLKLLVWQALLPKLCDCAMPMLPAVRRNPRLQQRLEFLSVVFPGPVEGLRLRNPHGCPACRVQGLSELYGYQGRSVAAEMIEPRSHPQWLEWVRERGRGGFPVPVRSAMASAMDAAYRGWFDPADIEQHFHPFSVEARLRAGANLASGAVAAGGVAAGQA